MRSWYRLNLRRGETMAHALRPGKPTEYPVRPRTERKCPRCGLTESSCREQADSPDPEFLC